MLRLTVTIPGDLTDRVTQVLSDSTAVSTLSVLRGAAVRPVGDVVHADVAREGANVIIDRLRELGVHEEWHAPDRAGHDVGLAGRVRGRRGDARQQRRRRRVGAGRPAVLRRQRAQLDLPVLHVAGDPHRRHRDRARLADPRHRRHGARAGVRCDRGARGRPRAASAAAARRGGPGTRRRLRRGDRRHVPRRARRPRARLGDARRHHRRRVRRPASSTRPTSGRSSSPSSRRRPGCSR